MVRVYYVNLFSAYPNNITKIVDFGTHFESILGPWANLGPPWDLNGEDMHSKPPFSRILSPNGGPIGDPKITLGASRWPSELPRTSFGGDFLWTCFLHEKRHPKLIQKVVFFGTLDVAKT